jgi:integrase
MPEYSSITALDALLDDIRVSEARRRQLGMVRGEMRRALGRRALPMAARGSLRRLLEEEALVPYRRLAESGALRARWVPGDDPYPRTSEATNEARAQYLDLLREAYGLPALGLGAGSRVPPQPTPDFGDLATLRRRLDQGSAATCRRGQTRLTVVVALILDAATRSGELVALRLSDLRAGAVYVDQRPPQRGGPPDGDWFALSPLGAAALERWLPVRRQFVERTHGTSKL